MALEIYDDTIRINPEYPETWNNRGISLCEIGHMDEAISSFERALALDPEYNEARENLERILTR